MKTIKLRNYEIEGILKILNNPNSILYTDAPEKKLPVSVLWCMDENTEKLRNIETRINKKRDEIEQDYVDDEHSYIDTDENGITSRRVKPEFAKEFGNRMTELMNIENEVEIKPIMIETLSEYSMIPSDYRSIRFMLDKEEENEEEEKEVTENDN